MLTSRKDILTDRIVQYENPFLLVPVQPYIEELKIEFSPPQNALVNALNNPKYRFIPAAYSRRVGKTYAANILAQIKSLEPGTSVLIMSPNYRLSQISFDLQRQLIKYFGLEIEKDNAKDGVILLPNGSSIRMGSVNQVDSVVGRSYDLILFDEAALSEAGRTAFDIQLRPTLDKPRSKAMFISTPRGRENWFHEFFNRGFDENFPEWCSLHATYEDNPRVDVRDVEEARSTMSAAHFKQEYMADFTTYDGLVFNFNSETCVGEYKDLEYADEVIIGLDHGYRDPTAFVVLACVDDKYYAIAEYFQKQESTTVIAQALKYYIDKYDVDKIYCDPASAQFRADLAYDHNIQTEAAKKSILDGINHVNAVMEQERLLIDTECVETLRAIEGYQWDTGGKEKTKHNWASHMSDALRYALYSHVTISGFM